MKASSNNIIIQIETDKDISDVLFLKSLLAGWKKLNPKSLPDSWGHGEFCRKSIDYIDNYSDLCAVWSDSHLPPTIARKAELYGMYSFNWLSKNADKNALKDSVFKYSMNGQLSKKADPEDLESLCSLYLDIFSPGYLAITTAKDFTTRHICLGRRIMPNGQSVPVSRFVGSTVGKLLPGLYWKTYLNDELSQRFGLYQDFNVFDLDKFGFKIEQRNGYTVLENLNSIADFTDNSWKQAQSAVEIALNRTIFFSC
ncbi:hypothetical protein GCM10007973_25630 [Polymorphobacter multimanifer]|uniref:Uncharacterized protein n=1 Tax=Polymorphobacter multimanifer TaxID=1070431 RepID=A0A841LA32_9SPHN|nr:hypothetical protein [Polymorphobacter multimanifer]MBB6229394.1 hypothetical protein [Polymorphobacter multimanifer]GGI88149.1 hypothetical protein GCM10007973_25630 [Polymorphobacter multimanifer]